MKFILKSLKVLEFIVCLVITLMALLCLIGKILPSSILEHLPDIVLSFITLSMLLLIFPFTNLLNLFGITLSLGKVSSIVFTLLYALTFVHFLVFTIRTFARSKKYYTIFTYIVCVVFYAGAVFTGIKQGELNFYFYLSIGLMMLFVSFIINTIYSRQTTVSIPAGKTADRRKSHTTVPTMTDIERQLYSPTEMLEKYKRLLDNGAITPEEYEAKKKELLGL